MVMDTIDGASNHRASQNKLLHKFASIVLIIELYMRVLSKWTLISRKEILCLKVQAHNSIIPPGFRLISLLRSNFFDLIGHML
jgi:hypothetical protein